MNIEQHGDYVIQLEKSFGDWIVRMAGSEHIISRHQYKDDAKKAVKRYQAADKRRS